MSRAEQLFAQIQAGGAGWIEQMVTDQVTEELFLDYKQSATSLPSTRLADDDRKNLAKAISGFGNSDGGVIVWGVRCRTGPSGDVPDRIVPIANPLQFKTLIDGQVGGLTLPPHTGVESISLQRPGQPDGFVVTHIPPGTSAPFVTTFPNQKYYLRSGSSFGQVPHGVLAGMFGRRPQPLIVGEFKPVAPQSVPGEPEAVIHYRVFLTNKGRGIADDLYVTVDQTEDGGIRLLLQAEPDQRVWDDAFSGAGWTAVSKPGSRRLPPGASVHAFTIAVGLRHGNISADLHLSGSCGSSSSPASVFMRTVTKDRLRQIAELLTQRADEESESRALRNEAFALL